MDTKLLNPLTLAYMGDAVLDQRVREYIVLKLQSKPNRLHQVSLEEAVTLKVIRKLKIQMYKRIVKVQV